MLDFLYRALRPALFSIDAERAHVATLRSLGAAPRMWAALAATTMGAPPVSLARDVAGLKFAGPIGLAGGLDRDGVAIGFWPSLGFGFIEVGSVTAHPQTGNQRPRLFRLEAERGLINRMNRNRGSAELAARLRELRERGRAPEVPIGVVIGKSALTPLEEATADFVTSTKRLAGLADYLSVNVSSPTTPGVRALQDHRALSELLPAVIEAAAETPVFVKLSPDLEDDEITSLVDHVVELGVAGVIATNTTTRRDVLTGRGDAGGGEGGGLSGAPLWPLARHCIQTVLDAAAGRVPVIGVGGVERAEQAQELLDAGCAAVQLYTALVYRGPGLPNRINAQLADRNRALHPLDAHA